MDTQEISDDLNTTIGETQPTQTSKCWAVLGTLFYLLAEAHH